LIPNAKPETEEWVHERDCPMSKKNIRFWFCVPLFLPPPLVETNHIGDESLAREEQWIALVASLITIRPSHFVWWNVEKHAFFRSSVSTRPTAGHPNSQLCKALLVSRPNQPQQSPSRPAADQQQPLQASLDASRPHHALTQHSILAQLVMLVFSTQFSSENSLEWPHYI